MRRSNPDRPIKQANEQEEEQATRARMLRTASRLLTTQGYHGTGLSQVLAEAPAPRGSLYFHFPGGKEQLAIEALHKSEAWVTRAVRAALDRDGGGDLRAGLRAFFDAFARRLEATGFTEGCPFATVALESGGLSDAVRRACADAYAGWHALFAARLAALVAPARAVSLATLILSSIEGALVLAKAHRDAGALRAVADELDGLLAALPPRSSRPRTSP
jgi:TetR/AcrR family transcriptional repressor of lmrAB and yxaGH operons